MAIVDNRDLIGDATSLTNWAGLTGGDAPALELETTPPGVTTVISNKVSNEVGGIIYDDGTTTTFADTDTIYIWYNTIFGPLDTIAGGGVRVYFAEATVTNFFSVIVDGTDSGRTGWQLVAINIGKARLNPDFSNSPPTAANIEQIGIQWDMVSNVGGNNHTVAIGNIYRQTNTEATYRVDAGTDGTPNTWQDIADQVLTDGTGVVIKETNGVFTLNGSIEFGPASGDVDMTFEDTGVVLAFNDQPFTEDDFYSLSIDLPGSYSGDARLTAGTKVGSGETAVGVAGWTIITGGPRWSIDMENTDQTDVQFYGCSFQGSGVWSVDDSSVEIISCVYSDCDQMTISGGSGGPTVLSNFFSSAPGPLAQIKWGNATTPTDGQFDFNSFVNMSWWAIEFDTTGVYNLRGVVFSGNGTDRDILASHNTGDVEVVVLEGGSTPGVTNGATITITTAGASDIRMTAVSLDNVNQTTPVPETNGANTISGGDPLTAAVTANDANSYLAAVYGSDVFGSVDWSGSDAYVEQIDVGDIINSAVTSSATKEGVTGSQTASADHSGTVLNAALSVIEVDNEEASPVLEVDPEWRPLEKTLASTTHVFGYGVPGTGDDLGAFVFIHTQDATAADTDVSSVDWGGTNMQEEQEDFADDSGGGGEGLRTTAFRLIGTNLRKGTVTITASVPIEVNGVTEGAQTYMEADGITGPLAAGTQIMNVAADSTGAGTSTFSGTVPQGTVVKARSSGTVGGVVSDEDGVAVTDQTTEARDRSTTDDIELMPGGATADIIYIGALDKFERVNFDIETIGVGAYTLTWEYSQGGDTWAALTVADGTGDFKNAGCSRVTFTAPGDWATDTVTSDSGGVGPFFFIRARGDGGGQSTAPLGNTISVAEGETIKYLPFDTTGTIEAGIGLTITAVWIPDVIAS